MKTTLTAIFTFFTGLFGPTGTVGMTLFAGGITALTFFTWLNSQMQLLITKVDALTVGSFAGTLNISPMGLLNTFIPLAETLTFFAAYLTVLGLCAVVRIVKSFVPTVAT